jgi:hypothetical protein
MPAFIERKDYEFLLMAEKFCTKVDQYTDLLGLNTDEVESLKNETHYFQSVFWGGPDSPGEEFSQHKIQNMRINLSHLAQHCKNNPNYTIPMGIDLGIEIPVYAFLAN